MSGKAYIPSSEELTRLYSVVKDSRHAKRNSLAIMLSYYSGLRVSEISYLKVQDVYNESGKVKSILKLPASYTKTKKSRDIPINDKLRKALQEFQLDLDFVPDNRKYGQDLPKHLSNKLVQQSALIRSQKKGHFSPNSLCQLFSRLYKHATGINSSSHAGRRWFITELSDRGINLKTIMLLVGHTKLSSTQEYIFTDPKQLSAAVNVL